MLTDDERRQLTARKLASEGRQSQPATISLQMAEWPDYPPPIDHNESLKAVAEAIDAINDEKLAGAITKGFAALQGNTQVIASLKQDLSALTEAVKKIPKGDMTGLIAAINGVAKENAKNTAALAHLAQVMSAPKAIVTNRNGEIVGSRIAEADDAVMN